VAAPAEDILARSRALWTQAAATWEHEGDVIAASTRAVTDALLEERPQPCPSRGRRSSGT